MELIVTDISSASSGAKPSDDTLVLRRGCFFCPGEVKLAVLFLGWDGEANDSVEANEPEARKRPLQVCKNKQNKKKTEASGISSSFQQLKFDFVAHLFLFFFLLLTNVHRY